MPTRGAQACPQRAAVEELAHGRLTGSDRQGAQRHLEHCEPCLALFRHLTADRFPAFRGYTILDEIGRGGFGRVYKAFHQGKARVEALKVLSAKTARREAYFENEVHLVARFRHANIATLYEAHLSKPPLYYAMEFVEGQHLDDYFRSRDVSLEERIEIIRKVACAIDYAHREGVVHRDLKPQNILIDAEGQPRIVDFGIAKKLGLAHQEGEPDESPRTSPEGPLGTFGYIAPEQIAGRSADERADVYALGVLLFHVITGQPARFANHVEGLTRVLREQRVSRADDLAAIIAHSVNPAPEERYPSCSTLVDDLERYLAGRETSACKDATPAYRAKRVATLVLRNYPRPVQAAVMVVVACALVVTFWLCQARWLAIGQGPERAAVISFTPNTLAAMQAGRLGADLPEFVPGNKKSWRLLYGRLLEQLAVAGPRAVIFDYYFPDCHPRFDERFISGIRAVKAPVIVGSKEFDVNGEPALCPDIRAAVHGWGTLYCRKPDAYPDEILVPMAVRRGYNPPTPSLALAGYAATRFPESDADLSIGERQVQLRYRKHAPAAGESRWEGQTDQLPVFNTEKAGPEDSPLTAGDELTQSRFPLTADADWKRPGLEFEDVLNADAEQLRRWFAGRVVLIGQVSPTDRYALQSGEFVYGYQVQAMLLDALLAETHIYRFSRRSLAASVCLWCVLGALLGSAAGKRSVCPLRVAALLGPALGALGVLLASYVALLVTSPWAVEAVIGLCALIGVSGPVMLVQMLHQRQLHLTPAPTWPAASAAGSTTVVVGTPKVGPN